MNTSTLSPLSYRFNAGRWVGGASFLGRTDLLLGALSCLVEVDQFHARRFLGRRRQGKTSLLHAIEYLARCINQPDRLDAAPPEGELGPALDLQEFAAACAAAGLLRIRGGDPATQLVPVYIDLRAHRRERDLATRIAASVQRPLQAKALARQIKDAENPMAELLRALGDIHLEQPFLLVLLADEARGLSPTVEELRASPELDQEVSGVIRALGRLTEQADVPVQLYLASSRGLDLSAGPLLKRLLDSVPVFPIGNLPDPSVSAMLQRSQLDAAEASVIREQSGGNPYFLHVLGFAAQNPGANAEPQIAAGIENDIEHLTLDELAWMRSLALGEPGPAPSSAPLLERCGYLQRHGEEGWALREPILQRWLLQNSDHARVSSAPLPRPTPPPAPPAPAKVDAPAPAPRPPTPRSSDSIPVDLARYPWPSRQRFGQLSVSSTSPVNLGAQCYILLHLLAECRLRNSRLTIQQEDAKYALYLVLALCGIDHGFLNPRGLLSGVRTSIKEALEEQGEDELSVEQLGRWLPRGRGGYRLGSSTEVMRAEHPLGHLELQPIDLIDIYHRWHEQRSAFLSFLKDSAINHTRGLSLYIRMRPASDNLFSRHQHVLHLEVIEHQSKRARIRLGPIPITEEQGVAFRYWKKMHMDEGWVRLGRLERQTRAEGPVVVRATDFCHPFEMLSLRGGAFTKGQKRWSSEWIPGPGTARDFPTSPRWLDLHLADEANAAPYGATELMSDLGY
ncbi:MAG: hypothetical protein H6740_04345 [Alphaproteobacteria bacterium]|nr:hypothetical protein [Alphaproteobacteria bacterium]